jgi:hypothetical protein
LASALLVLLLISIFPFHIGDFHFTRVKLSKKLAFVSNITSSVFFWSLHLWRNSKALKASGFPRDRKENYFSWDFTKISGMSEMICEPDAGGEKTIDSASQCRIDSDRISNCSLKMEKPSSLQKANFHVPQ